MDADIVADGGQDAEPSFCDGLPGAMICDDFEGNLDRWDTETKLGTVQRDVTRGYQSASSFKSELTGSGIAQLQLVLPDSVKPGETLYAQMRVLVPSGPLNSVSIFWLGGQQGTSLSLQDWDLSNTQTEPNLMPWNTVYNQWIGFTQLTPDKWTCLDIRIVLDEKSDEATPKGAFEASVDGVVAMTTSSIFTFEPSGPFGLRIGLTAESAEQGAYAAWFDDVAVAKEPLPPCSEPMPAPAL